MLHFMQGYTQYTRAEFPTCVLVQVYPHTRVGISPHTEVRAVLTRVLARV